MNRIHPFFEFAIGLLLATVVAATNASEVPKPQEIPLDRIWGYELPGTKDVRELEPKADPKWSIEELTRRLDVWKISKVLQRRPKEGETAGSGFVVSGSGREALRNAARVLRSGRAAQTEFLPETDLTLVVYSHLCGRYVRLIAVNRAADSITVEYQFVSHVTQEMSFHFALIPLGKLPPGTYQVRMKQLEPIDQRDKEVKPIDEPQRFVSESFSFTVQRE